MIRTKIVATMGPACSEVDTLLRLFEAGVDVCRLNFSHGDLPRHLEMLTRIREAAAKHQHPIAVLGDLGGPKIRLGQVADQDTTGGMTIKVGDELVIQRKPIVGERGRVSSTYDLLVDDVQVGHRVFIEDGLLRFVCTDKVPDALCCRCTVGGILKSSKGVNLPDTIVNVPSITDRDWECCDWAVENQLDYLAMSFVRKADDLKMLRGYLTRKASDIHLVAKIEKAEALKEIDGILQASDGLMVARGDLGVEMDVAQVPIIQKDLIRRCQLAGKPVIVATQMLQSMIEQASPTRAEVSDVANAIFDGTDVVMLSAETSVGKFPVGAVLTMAHVADVTENYLVASQGSGTPGAIETSAPKVDVASPSSALARGAWRIVQDVKIKIVVIWSQNGSTARVFSKHHFPVSIIALSSDPRALRRMALLHGVLPQEMARPESMTELVAQVDNLLLDRKLASASDRVLLVAGWSPAIPDTMNGIIMHTVGDKWATISPAQQPAPGSGGKKQ
ncbi:MAG: pyruvate kinase [Tepidisphaeraceae bacterium]